MQAADWSDQVAILIDLSKYPQDVGHFWFDVPGIFQEVAKTKEQFSLHASHKISDLIGGCAASPKSF
jgi:hypothetical protein